MSATRRRILSVAAVVGMAGGSVAGWAVDNGTKPTAAQASQVSGQQTQPDAMQRLDARVTALLAQERALHRALGRAKAQLQRKAANGEASLAALRGRITAAQELLRREQAAIAATRAAAATESQRAGVEVDDGSSGDGQEFSDDGYDDNGGDDSTGEDRGGEDDD